MAKKEILVVVQITKEVRKKVLAEDEAQAVRLVKDNLRTIKIQKGDIQSAEASEIISTL